jgi:hypothetical protein
MDAGRVRLGFTMIGTFVHAEHDVSPHEPEPGVTAELQPHRHLLDMTLLEWDFDAQIAFSRRFAFEAFLPVRTTVIRASFQDDDGNDLPGATSIHHRDETIAGLGDVVLGGRIALVLPENVPRWQLDLRLATTIPTGHTEADPFARGERGLSHQHIFFGSGTVDPVLGFESNVALAKLGITTWVSSRVPLYRSHFGYRHSRSVAAGVGVLTGFGLQRWTFLAQPEVFFETPAHWPERAAPNSGRTSLIATAGVFVRPAEPVQLHLLLKVPYYTRSHGGQLRWPIVALVGATFTFDMRPQNAAARALPSQTRSLGGQ